VHAIVCVDVSNGDAAASFTENISAGHGYCAPDDTPEIRLVPHVLALSNVALSLQLNSESMG
jgi:hypothetical protein